MRKYLPVVFPPNFKDGASARCENGSNLRLSRGFIAAIYHECVTIVGAAYIVAAIHPFTTRLNTVLNLDVNHCWIDHCNRSGNTKKIVDQINSALSNIQPEAVPSVSFETKLIV